MSDKDQEKQEKQYQRQRWMEENKDKLIAYTIMIGMVTFFIIYLIVAIKNHWDIHFG